MTRDQKEQLAIFSVACAGMVGVFVWTVATCPLTLGQVPLFSLGVAETLGVAGLFAGAARILS